MEDRLACALRALEDAKAAIRDAQAGLGQATRDAVQDAIERTQQANTALVMVLLTDELCPAKLFAPWASVRRIRDWGAAGKLQVVIRHGRCCIRPTDFFRHWNTLAR